MPGTHIGEVSRTAEDCGLTKDPHWSTEWVLTGTVATPTAEEDAPFIPDHDGREHDHHDDSRSHDHHDDSIEQYITR